ncbi:deacylase [Hahella sp. CCB-MM4]|uniref:succinylglutamate desuccinylase/aspartoacylase family protein n=1 Tax=Hahella sp. (strain CCB-MM4) TaxID=1926491 RepID=UPI000B9BE807|nr:succinylglutamate desuccinylase/aspartoacylase family protein [Hahella sp. CCB-MM4]OZG73287.1 deacylase [Hahella sp. CCB-MM4]
MRSERLALMSPSPGTRRELLVYRFGKSGTGPKVYIQAGLHADEWPGLLVVQHLLPMLADADAREQIKGEIIVVPYANPIGMGQNVFGYVAGRFDLTGTGNFNRNFGDLYQDTYRQVDGRLGENAEENKQLVIQALKNTVANLPSDTESAALKKILLGLSIDADYVFDLHCDDRTSGHVYCVDNQLEIATALCQRLGFRYLFTEDLNGIVAFDGTHLQPWHWLQKDFPRAGLHMPPLAVTIEYRGQYDVEDQVASDDARNLFGFLMDRGIVSGEAGEPVLKEIWISSLQAVDTMYAETTGLLVFSEKLDTWLNKGDIFAEIVLLDGEPNQRVPCRARTNGYLMGLSHRRLVRPGDQIAKVAGQEPLSHRMGGNLLQL